MDDEELRRVMEAASFLVVTHSCHLSLRGRQWVQIGKQPDGLIYVHSESHPQPEHFPSDGRLAMARMLQLLRA